MRRSLRALGALGALGLAWLSGLAGPLTEARGDATVALLVSGGEDGAEVVRAAAAAELERAGWSLPALTSAASARLRGCLGAEAAWPCLEPRLVEGGLTKLVAIQLAVEPAGKAQAALRLVGQLGSLEGRRLTAQSRYCWRCDDAQLAEAARLLVRKLIAASALRDDATRIEVRTQPPGAVLRLDGRLVEAPGGIISCSPGLHTVHVQRNGYRSELRAVLVEEGKAVAVEVTLLPERAGASPRGGPVARIERIELGGARASGQPGAAGRGRQGARPEEVGAPSLRGPLASTAPGAAAPSRGPRAERPTKPARPAPKLAWIFALGGGALLAAGATLLWLDEDARDDASVRHTPRYFDSAPAGVAVMTAGGLAAITGVVLFMAPAAQRAPASAASSSGCCIAPTSTSGRGPAGATQPALLFGLRGAF